MHVQRLISENFKRLKLIDLKLDKDCNIIGGKNKAGKTSAIQSLFAALRGMKDVPNNPIRNGEDKASVFVDLGEYRVTKTFKRGSKPYLKLEKADGSKPPSPQKVLDDILGPMFDPMEFCQKEARERKDILKQIIPTLDFTKQDQERTAIFAQRTDVNRDQKRGIAQLEKVRDLIDPGEIPTYDDIAAEKKKVEDWNFEASRATSAIQAYENKIEGINKHVLQMLEDIDQIQEKINLKKEELDTIPPKIAELDKVASRKPKDISQFDTQIKSIMEKQSQKKDWDAKELLLIELKQIKKEWDTLTSKIELIDKAKADALKNAKMPIDGLGISDLDVTFEGIEFSQLSSAQQIEVSMAISIAINPKLKVICIFNGSLLDAESMELVKSIAKKKGFQLIIEYVMDSNPGNAIYIEDGEVVQESAAETDYDL